MMNKQKICGFYLAAMLLFCYCNLFAENISEARYDSLAMKFYDYEMRNNYDDFAMLQSYNQSTIRSFLQTHEYSISQDNNNITSIKKILIVVSIEVYEEMPDYVIRYAHDIHNVFGCSVDIVSVNGGSPPQIKSLIQSYSNKLNGAVFIGHIAPAYYFNEKTSTGSIIWKEDHYPCDLFYMDLNGTWHLKDDGTGWYDDHSGNVKPEIFVGRINTSSTDADEIEELKCYLDKDHRYWTGKKRLNKQRALTFTQDDWNTPDFTNSVSPLYGNSYYDAVNGDDFTKDNYLDYLQDDDYEYIQLACHSYYEKHKFDSSIYVTNVDIQSLSNKKAIGYNLFCCHACNWMSSFSAKCLGESYLYDNNSNSEALAVVGSTKTGGMLGFSDFYNPLGSGKCIGEAYRQWWINHCGISHSQSERLWFYGMCILGDPLVNFKFTNDCDNIITLNCGEETDNNMYYAQNKIIVQNYSITQGQNVTLSAPTIHIIGNFRCSSPSVFRTNHCCPIKITKYSLK